MNDIPVHPDVETARQHLHADRITEAEVLLRAVLADAPDDAEALHLMAVARLKAGDISAAIDYAERAANLAPTAIVLNTLGSLRLRGGDHSGAQAAFTDALARDADFIEARLNLADSLAAGFDMAAAERHYRLALDVAPDDIDALNNLASLLIETERRPEAHELLQRAAIGTPNSIAVLANLANNAERLGRVDDARDAATRLADLDPKNPVAALVLARIARRDGDPARAHDLLHEVDPLTADAINVQVEFERAQVFDRLDRADDAFAATLRAHALRRATLPPDATDPVAILNRVATMRAWVTAERLAIPDISAENGETPVFFVGFPRSGTTLMERILSAHPDIVTSGERSPLPTVRRLIAAEGSYPEGLDSADDAAMARYRQCFHAEADALGVAPPAGRILVDKMPMNIIDLVLARRLFPTAPIVVMLRDPRDVTLSCLMQPFSPNIATAAFTELRSAATLCAETMGLWAHMRLHLAPPWLEVRYEDLIDDTAGTARRVIDLLGLPWDPRIVDDRRRATASPATTPSYADVGADISTRAAGRWQRYRRHLEPVLPILAPVVTAFDY